MENLTRNWQANIYVYRWAADRLLRGPLSRPFLQDEDRCFMAGIIDTLFTFPTTSRSKIYTQQSGNTGSREVSLSHAVFLISSVFSYMPPPLITSSPAARDKTQIVSFSPAPCRSKIRGFWTQTNTFPSVREICSSSRCIRDESFCSLPKPKSQLTYHSNSHP